jgi:hypothetical protein
MPGAGKSVLLATAIHHAQSLFARQADIAVIFAFCDNRDTAKQTGENIIASLWRQLVRRRNLSKVECADLEASYVDAGIRPTPSTLPSLLSSEMRRYRRVFIFLDALDELTVKHRDSLMFLLPEIPNQQNLFLTSRFLDSEYPLPGERVITLRYGPEKRIFGHISTGAYRRVPGCVPKDTRTVNYVVRSGD